VVEDNPDLCWVLARMLEGQGYHVITAMDGEEGWQAYLRHRVEIRLALLDVMLPKLGGYDLFSRIRALDPGLPAIFTSGYPGSLSETPPPGAEKVPLLRKPYRNEELYRMIRELLGTGGGPPSSMPAGLGGKAAATPENGGD
jgi:CheY-like chemotaxis protein